MKTVIVDNKTIGRPNKIKILVISGSLGVGGAEVQISKILPRLSRDVFDVQVAYYSDEDSVGYPKKILMDSGIPVTFLGVKGTEWNKRRFLISAFKFMKKEKFDLVHAIQHSDNHYGRIPAILTGVEVVIGGLQGKKGLEGMWALLYSLMNLRCNGWIVNSQMLKNWAEERMYFMDRSPVMIVRNGLELDIDERFRRDEFTSYDQLKSNRPIIGIVGRLHPVKNHLTFVAMAHLLTQAGVDADYWIIGEGRMRGEIEEAIGRCGLQDRVKLLGLREDVDVALSRMDIGVLTSDSESCPNALLEAMRASLPVVSTNCTLLEGIIEEGINGHVVDIGDAQGLADKVRLLLSDAEKRHEMGIRSRQIIEEKFNLSLAVNDLESAYVRFLTKKSSLSPKLQKKLAEVGLL